MGGQYFINPYIDVISEKSLFLEEKGLKKTSISDYTISYSLNEHLLIDIYYGRYSDSADVGVRFTKTETNVPEHYSIGWIRKLQRYENGEILKKDNEKVEKIEEILSLLDFLEDNFDCIIDIEYCRSARKKINVNFERGIW